LKCDTIGGEFTHTWEKKFLQSSDEKMWRKETTLNILT